MPSRPRAEFSLGVGERLGELTVIGHLARGRMTELYQVWSNEHWCALTGKLIAPEHLDRDDAIASLRREEQVLRKLQHPNIVRLFGSGGADGRPYLLLEYLNGPSLFEVLEAMPKRRLHVPDAIRAVMHIGAAIHFLHRRGYLYRDLKPGNILLRDGIPILVDFDVVCRVTPQRRPPDRLGTAPYMAPEQIRRDPLSPATDVYGLGALLYELLTGRWPTEAPRDEDEEWEEDDWEDPPVPFADLAPLRGAGQRAELPEEYYPQMSRPPVPPCEHNPQVRGELQRVILRCLAQDPERRFRSVSGLLAALAPMLKGRYRLWPAAAPIERRSDTESR